MPNLASYRGDDPLQWGGDPHRGAAVERRRRVLSGAPVSCAKMETNDG